MLALIEVGDMCNGLTVNSLESASKAPGLSLTWVTMLCSQAGHFTLADPLSTQEYNEYQWEA